MPSPVTTYMTANTARSLQPIRSVCHASGHDGGQGDERPEDRDEVDVALQASHVLHLSTQICDLLRHFPTAGRAILVIS